MKLADVEAILVAELFKDGVSRDLLGSTGC